MFPIVCFLKATSMIRNVGKVTILDVEYRVYSVVDLPKRQSEFAGQTGCIYIDADCENFKQTMLETIAALLLFHCQDKTDVQEWAITFAKGLTQAGVELSFDFADHA